MTLHKSWVFLYNWCTAQPKARAAWVLVFLWKCSILFSLFFLSNGSDLKSLDFSASPEGPKYTGKNVSHAKRKMTRVGRERETEEVLEEIFIKGRGTLHSLINSKGN